MIIMVNRIIDGITVITVLKIDWNYPFTVKLLLNLSRKILLNISNFEKLTFDEYQN